MSDFDWGKVDWDDYYPRLVYFAARKMGRLTWRGQRGGSIPGGWTAKDFAQDAIRKTIEGTRVWNREVSLLQHLLGVISGEIYHQSKHSENKAELRADEKIVLLADHQVNPETAALRKLEEEQFLAHLGAKRAALRQLAHTMLHEQYQTSDELTRMLNLSHTQLESLQRALRRATEEYLQLDNEQTTQQA